MALKHLISRDCSMFKRMVMSVGIHPPRFDVSKSVHWYGGTAVHQAWFDNQRSTKDEYSTPYTTSAVLYVG